MDSDKLVALLEALLEMLNCSSEFFHARGILPDAPGLQVRNHVLADTRGSPNSVCGESGKQLPIVGTVGLGCSEPPQRLCDAADVVHRVAIFPYKP